MFKRNNRKVVIWHSNQTLNSIYLLKPSSNQTHKMVASHLLQHNCIKIALVEHGREIKFLSLKLLPFSHFNSISIWSFNKLVVNFLPGFHFTIDWILELVVCSLLSVWPAFFWIEWGKIRNPIRFYCSGILLERIPFILCSGDTRLPEQTWGETCNRKTCKKDNFLVVGTTYRRVYDAPMTAIYITIFRKR